MRGIGTAAGAGARDAATTGAEEAGGSRATAADSAADREGRVRAAPLDPADRDVPAGGDFRMAAAERVRPGRESIASRGATGISAAGPATGRRAGSRVRAWT
ncbi:MAG: hypothetical protein PHI39_03420 [Kiritimatiellae bacterium]|jgi:hypothetical protein|nr:hypothetical protein [Kiritimatiellia bacterium]